jgi:4-alpha-glucanotransferase
VAWWDWSRALAMREPAAVAATCTALDTAIQTQRFAQFLFFRQWERLRSHAIRCRVKLFGDVPIYVAEDSADVWCHPELFRLDDRRRPVSVAGVPPDYFSETGQLWGNPVYDWDAHRRSGFRWWIARLRAAVSLFDQVRIDHFRGIEAYWAVPAGEPTAAGGQWLPGPRDELLTALQEALGSLPVVAEDLGFITAGVDDLRARFGLPGMRILQFAFGGAVEGRFRPHRFTRDLLVTTGTHDNDTTRGWFEGLTEAERRSFQDYVPGARSHPVWALIRLAWASVAEQAIAPLQDLLDLGSEARMNRPGQPSGNWRWRASEADTGGKAWAERLAEIGRVYERTGGLENAADRQH